MRKMFLICFMLFLLLNLSAVLEETASLREFIYGNTEDCDYDNWVSHVAEGIASTDYNLYAPWDRQTSGFGNYIEPSEQQLFSWSAVIEMFLEEDFQTVDTYLDVFNYPYQLVIFDDTDTGNTYYILREIPNFLYTDDNGTEDITYDDEIGAFQYGWGIYIFNPEASLPIIVTAPHPNDDYITVPMAIQGFQEWDAMFFIASGTGREVKWNQADPPYTNSKSLCDPSRVEDHPFNIGYQQFCDYMRAQFNRRELSIQVHSYDWGTRHEGYANTQISAGYQRGNPGLPIRDISSYGKDIINVGDYIVHHPNEVGIHLAVDLHEFYTVNYTQGAFVYDNGEVTVNVNNYMDLPGFSSNRQFLYTKTDWNEYDVFEPFFHIEMDELPNIYSQNQANYKWFHGWNASTQQWDWDKRYTYFFDYYHYWIESLGEAIPYAFELDDQMDPPQVSNLDVAVESKTYITLEWNPVDCFDFDSYRIYYSTEPLENDNYEIIDRDDQDKLASAATSQLKINFLDPDQQYYFAIDAVDKMGNISPMSEEISGFTGNVRVTGLDAYSDDGQVILSWQAASQSENQGFSIFRRTADQNYQLISSFADNTELLSNNVDGQSFVYVDEGLVNYQEYYYLLSSIGYNGMEYFHSDDIYAAPCKVFNLVFQQETGQLSDTLYFGMSPFASDLYDTDYDYESNDEDSGNYFYAHFHEPEWEEYPYYDPTTYYQEIHGYYNQELSRKDWKVRFKTNQIDEPVNISITNLDRDAERMYLIRNGIYYDLFEGSYSIDPVADAFIEFELYWGNLLPELDFSDFGNRILTPGETVEFNWGLSRIPMIDYIDIEARNDDVSIPLALEMDPQINSIQWTIPQLYIDNLEIVMKLHMIEGDVVEYTSPFMVGIIPGNTTINSPAGWNLINYPYSEFIDDPIDIYGQDSQFFYVIDQVFLETTDIFTNTAYWHFAPEDHTYDVNGLSYENSYFNYDAFIGWNLIPNPYVIPVDISQIVFYFNGVNYSYNEAVQNRLIESVFVKYNNSFFPARVIDPLESAYLYCYEDGIQLKFEPYHQPPFTPELQVDWTFDFFSSLWDSPESANIRVGVSEWATDSYDEEYDYLQPQLRPVEDNITMGIHHDYPELDIELCLGQDLTHPSLADSIQYQWDGYIKLDSLQQIEFFSRMNDIPEEFFTYLLIDNLSYLLTDTTSVIYSPEQTEFDFSLLFTQDYFTDSQEETIPQKISLNNYPNPFNPETTLAFNLPTAGNVKLNIYNIKGQLVKTLTNEYHEAGNYEMIWDGRDTANMLVSSGVYLYKLETGDKNLTRKMLLLK